MEKPEFKDYVSCFFMGKIGTQPMDSKIESVDLIGDSISVCGQAFDKNTGETFETEIWIGVFMEKTKNNGSEDLFPMRKQSLLVTGSNGQFCVKFKIHPNDVLCMDQLGYDPAVFEVYQYIQDARLMW